MRKRLGVLLTGIIVAVSLFSTDVSAADITAENVSVVSQDETISEEDSLEADKESADEKLAESEIEDDENEFLLESDNDNKAKEAKEEIEDKEAKEEIDEEDKTDSLAIETDEKAEEVEESGAIKSDEDVGLGGNATPVEIRLSGTGDCTVKNGVYILWGKGKKMHVNVKVYPASAAAAGLRYEITNPRVATIDQEGNIEAVSTFSQATVVKVYLKNNSTTYGWFKLKVVQDIESLDLVSADSNNELAAGCTKKLNIIYNKNESIPRFRTAKLVAYEKEDDVYKVTKDVTVTNAGAVRAAKTVTDNKKIYIQAVAQDGTNVKSDYFEFVLKSAPVKNITFIGEEGQELNVRSAITICSGDSIGEYKNYYKISAKTMSDLGTQSKQYLITGTGVRVGTVSYVENEILDGESYTGYLVKSNNNNVSGNIILTASSTDGSNKRTRLNIKVINPVRDIALSSNTGLYDVPAGLYITMKAVPNRLCTTRQIVWSLVKEDTVHPGNYIDAKDEAKAEGITITTGGKVSVERGSSTTASTGHQYYVMASAKDLSGTYAVKPITVYAQTTNVNVSLDDSFNTESYTVKSELNVGETTYIKVSSNSGALCAYTITYTGNKNDIQILNAEGTSIKVTPSRKGRYTVMATTRDGSRKASNIKIYVK